MADAVLKAGKHVIWITLCSADTNRSMLRGTKVGLKTAPYNLSYLSAELEWMKAASGLEDSAEKSGNPSDAEAELLHGKNDVQSLAKSSGSDGVVHSHWYYGICLVTSEARGLSTPLVTFFPPWRW